MLNYINVSVKVPDSLAEMAIAYISLFDTEGIEERQNELVICFREENWNAGVKSQLSEILASIDEQIIITEEMKVAEQNWNEQWEKEVPVVIVNNNIGIAPSSKLNQLNTAVKIEINPKMSFGTGTHASTRLMCRMEEKYVRPGATWLDAGCGTGVLAILAAMLGAGKLIAFDNNEWAIMNSKENFLLNNVENKIELHDWDLDEMELPQSDGILANLNLGIVLNSIPKFYKSLADAKGILIVSGILYDDFDEVAGVAAANGFRHVETAGDEEWISIVFRAE